MHLLPLNDAQRKDRGWTVEGQWKNRGWREGGQRKDRGMTRVQRNSGNKGEEKEEGDLDIWSGLEQTYTFFQASGEHRFPP